MSGLRQPTCCACSADCSAALRLPAPAASAVWAAAWACRFLTWASCCARAAFREAFAACTDNAHMGGCLVRCWKPQQGTLLSSCSAEHSNALHDQEKAGGALEVGGEVIGTGMRRHSPAAGHGQLPAHPCAGRTPAQHAAASPEQPRGPWSAARWCPAQMQTTTQPMHALGTFTRESTAHNPVEPRSQERVLCPRTSRVTSVHWPLEKERCKQG